MITLISFSAVNFYLDMFKRSDTSSQITVNQRCVLCVLPLCWEHPFCVHSTHAQRLLRVVTILTSNCSAASPLKLMDRQPADRRASVVTNVNDSIKSWKTLRTVCMYVPLSKWYSIGFTACNYPYKGRHTTLKNIHGF